MGTALRIGLTGGIASGKSAVATAFANLRVPVVDADELARQIVAPGQPALAAVIAEFGPEILGPDGALDRRRLRRIVFADIDRRRRLEAILHPAIRAAMAAEVATLTAAYVVIVIPLLVESGPRDAVDRVLVVDCPPEIQLARLMARDGETRANALAIIASQAGRADRLAFADEVLANAGTPGDLVAAVAGLHARYLSLAAGRPARPP